MTGECRGETLAVPNSVGSAPPLTPAPAGAVDCHMHVFDPRFAYVPGRSPDTGTVDQYLLLRRRLGLQRCIVVAPSSYGFDNSCLLDALARFGASARGVASIAPDVRDDELHRLHTAGVRGIRVNFGRIASTAVADIALLARRIQPLNWHLQLHMPADELVANEGALHDLPVTLVIDHMGRAPQPGGLGHPVVRTLERLLASGNSWTKLSYLYEENGARLADYAQLARHLLDAAPERVLWGSDWPHGNKREKPDDAEVFDQIARWAPDAALRRRLLVDNPDALYWRD
jgi:D-galactarolactone isomerase